MLNRNEPKPAPPAPLPSGGVRRSAGTSKSQFSSSSLSVQRTFVTDSVIHSTAPARNSAADFPRSAPHAKMLRSILFVSAATAAFAQDAPAPSSFQGKWIGTTSVAFGAANVSSAAAAAAGAPAVTPAERRPRGARALGTPPRTAPHPPLSSCPPPTLPRPTARPALHPHLARPGPAADGQGVARVHPGKSRNDDAPELLSTVV